MAQIQKGTTYSTGDQVTAANLNALADAAILLPGAITDQTAKTVPLAADTILLHSAADTALRKSTLTQLFASPQPIGATTPSTGAFTTLSATGITLSTGDFVGNSGTQILGDNGTVGAPFFSFDGDADTGAYRPTANRFGIAAGGSLIGDFSAAGLAVTGSLSTTLSVTATGGFVIGNDNSYLYDSGTGAVTLRLGASGPYGSFLTNSGDFMVDGPSGTLALGAGGTRVATISSTGLGIGTTSPNQLLHIEKSQNSLTGINIYNANAGASAQAGVFLRNVSSGSASGGGAFLVLDVGNNVSLINQFGNPVIFGTNGTERMRIDGSGNVGIGTSSPGTTLDVQAANASLRVYGTGASDTPQFQLRNGSQIWQQIVDGADSNKWKLRTGAGTAVLTCDTSGNVTISGALSKGSGSFRIEHPLPEKSATHQLVHSFIEGPQADLIYRGKVVLVDGKASVNIDAAATMTEGTFEVLCRDVQCFTTNETGWTAVRGKVTGNILTIEAKDVDCADEISWMVIGERQDPHMMETDWTDDNGKVIVEPLKPSIESK